VDNKYKNFADLAHSVGVEGVSDSGRPVVCVQGMGFVGVAMAVAVATARDASGNLIYDVIGVDLANKDGQFKVDSVNTGSLPLTTTDPKLKSFFADAYAQKNFVATTDSAVFALADTVLVDVHLDVIDKDGVLDIAVDGFKAAIRTLAEHISPETLVIIETTVPPGACEHIVAPELNAGFEKRGIAVDQLMLAHSYERVMPGDKYLDSIINFWRVFSGYNQAAGDKCEEFMTNVINIAEYPLTRLHSTNASETAKVLENSYRAMNIAFIEEWGQFAEAIDVDLFQVLDAIRYRPTHNNIRQPGFGVGGYCLTKDPLFAKLATEKLFGLPPMEFPFSVQAVKTNKKSPLVSLAKVEKELGGSIQGKKILLLGVSYRQDVGDTRYSPSEVFVNAAMEKGAQVVCQDPLVDTWPELDMAISMELGSALLEGVDAVVFAVPHKEYKDLDVVGWLNGASPIILDANAVLSGAQRTQIYNNKTPLYCIGRGTGL